jgi:hypothetical protein
MFPGRRGSQFLAENGKFDPFLTSVSGRGTALIKHAKEP